MFGCSSADNHFLKNGQTFLAKPLCLKVPSTGSDDGQASYSGSSPAPTPAACPHRRHLGNAVSVIAKMKIPYIQSDSNRALNNFVPGYYCMDRRPSKIMTPVESWETRGTEQIIDRTVRG